MSKLTVIATLRAQAGKEAALKEVLTALVVHTRREPGCIDYHLHQQNDDSAVFVFYENWQDQAELDKHMQQPYMRELAALGPDLLAEAPTLQFLHMVSAPTE